MTDEQPEVEGADAELAHLEESQGGFDAHLKPFYETWLRTFIYDGRVDHRLRELAILRILWRCNRRFEWGNHYRFARKAGTDRETIASIKTSDPAGDLDGPVALVVRAADEMVDEGFVQPSTVADLADLFPTDGLLDEFLYCLAGYRMFASVSQSKPTQPLAQWDAWPPDGVAPG